MEQVTPVEMSIDEKVAAAKKFTTEANPLPDIPEPPADFVKLDGGFLFEGEEYRSAVVRELTGEHEESLARALKSGNGYHFLQVLLECGVASIGDISESHKVKKALRSMLIGDRDSLALAIRVATYGDTLEVLDWACPSCGGKTSLELNLTEADVVPHKTLDKVSEIDFEVKLKKGKAKVRLPNGADQIFVFEDEDLTGAERDSRLLQRCVLSVTDADGKDHMMLLEPGYILKMSIPDRRAILKQLSERQPGPQYNEVKFTHEECGNEVTISMGLVDLFRDLLLFL